MRLTELYTKELEKIHGSFERTIANFLRNPWMSGEALKYAFFVKDEKDKYTLHRSISNYSGLYNKTVELIGNLDSDASIAAQVDVVLKQLKMATKYVIYELKLKLLTHHNDRYLQIMSEMGFVFTNETARAATLDFIQEHNLNLRNIITDPVLFKSIVIQYEPLFKDVLDAVIRSFEQQWHFLKSFHSLLDPEFRKKVEDSHGDFIIHFKNLRNRYDWAKRVELQSPGELARIQQSYLNSISGFDNSASSLGFGVSFKTLEETVCKDPRFTEKGAMFLELKKIILNFQSCNSDAEYRRLQIECCDRHIEGIENMSQKTHKTHKTAALFSPVPPRKTDEKHHKNSALLHIPHPPRATP